MTDQVVDIFPIHHLPQSMYSSCVELNQQDVDNNLVDVLNFPFRQCHDLLQLPDIVPLVYPMSSPSLPTRSRLR